MFQFELKPELRINTHFTAADEYAREEAPEIGTPSKIEIFEEEEPIFPKEAEEWVTKGGGPSEKVESSIEAFKAMEKRMRDKKIYRAQLEKIVKTLSALKNKQHELNCLPRQPDTFNFSKRMEYYEKLGAEDLKYLAGFGYSRLALDLLGKYYISENTGNPQYHRSLLAEPNYFVLYKTGHDSDLGATLKIHINLKENAREKRIRALYEVYEMLLPFLMKNGAEKITVTKEDLIRNRWGVHGIITATIPTALQTKEKLIKFMLAINNKILETPYEFCFGVRTFSSANAYKNKLKQLNGNILFNGQDEQKQHKKFFKLIQSVCKEILNPNSSPSPSPSSSPTKMKKSKKIQSSSSNISVSTAGSDFSGGFSSSSSNNQNNRYYTQSSLNEKMSEKAYLKAFKDFRIDEFKENGKYSHKKYSEHTVFPVNERSRSRAASTASTLGSNTVPSKLGLN